jgi:hypothetical protein
MNQKAKLIELAAKAEGTVKELGIFTKNRPQYDAEGRFSGMDSEIAPGRVAAGVVGGSALGVGGVMANNAVQAGFGGQGVESWKQAGRYAANEAGDIAAKVPGAFGSGVRAGKASWRMTGKSGFGSRVAKAAKAVGRNFIKGFDAKLALKELAAQAVLVELAANAKGQRPEDNWKRAAGMGFLVGGPTGMILTQPNANESERAGVVYGKRNAAGDVLRTGVGAAGGSIAGNIAGMATGGAFSKNARAIHGADMGKVMRHAQVGNLAGGVAGLGLGYLWARKANKGRIARAQAAKQAPQS